MAGARWIDRESYHITLRFIGDIPEHLAREITYELEGVEARPFALRLSGIGLFGGNKPHTLYVAVEESPDLGACRLFMSGFARRWDCRLRGENSPRM